MASHKKILLLFAFLFIGEVASAQLVRFRHLTVEEGLSQNAVPFILQSKKGFIWIGTFDGLNKYDGNKIVTWKGSVDDTTSIASNSMRCIFEDTDEMLWVGTTGGGMFRLDQRSGKITNYFVDSTLKNCISSDNVNAICEYEPGQLMVGTNNGLNFFDKKTGLFTVIKKDSKHPIQLASNNVKAITRDTRGHIWFAHTDAGVTEYDPETKKNTYYNTASADHRINSNTVRTVLADSRGCVWISCWVFGQNIVDTKSGKIYDVTDTAQPYKSIKKATMITQYYEDKKGNIWMATAEEGLCCFNPKNLEEKFYRHNPDDPESISDNTVWSICEDRSGIIWCGTWKGGVNLLDVKSARFGLYRHESNNPTSIHNSNVSCFAKKNDNELYIGTAGGISVYNITGNTFAPLPYDEKKTGIRHNSPIFSLFRDDDNTLWISTSGSGLFRYHPDTKIYDNFIPSESDSTSLTSDWPAEMVKDKKGRLWIATMNGGLNVFDYKTKSFKYFIKNKKDPNAISANTILALMLRPDQKLWVGTNEGLNLLDPETGIFEKFIRDKNNKLYFPDIGISSLLYARNGLLWVGTTAGISSFDEKTKTATSYHKIAPMFANRIYTMAEDNSGNIWFSSTTGICRFNPTTKEYKIFNTTDGLQGMEFNNNAVYKAPGGKIYFGGSNGMNVFIPEEIRENTSPPLVAITAITALNQPYVSEEDIAYLSEIELSWREYFFSVEFAALDFTNPKKNTFSYMLEGFNERWVNNGNSHIVTFTNLDPGEYTLLVKAKNNDGFESSESCRLKIIITPPFWRTTWFYIGCGFAVVALFYLYIQMRERKLRKEKSVLEEKVNERTVELSEEKKKLELAYQELNEKNKEVIDSIRYAKRIQQALITSELYIERSLKELKKS